MSPRANGRDGLGDDRENLRAFVLDDATRKVVEQVVSELAIPNSTIHRGDIKDAIAHLGTRRSPHTLVVDISASEMPLSDVHDLAEVCEPGINVVAIGDKNDVGLFRELTKLGVSDYLVRPIPTALLQKSLGQGESVAPGRPTKRLGRLVVTIGARGGVGTTTVAANLGWLIAHRRRRRAAIVDLDLQMGSVALTLDLDHGHGLREALKNSARVDGVLLDRISQKASETLYVLGSEESLAEELGADREAIQHLMEHLRSKFHFVVVDLPRHMTVMTHQVMALATDIVVVADPTVVGLRDTIRLSQLVPTINASCKILHVLNKVGAASQGEVSLQDFQKGLGRPVDFVLPFDARTMATASNGGKPVAQLKSKIATVLDELSERICGTSKAQAQPIWQRLLPMGNR